MWLTEKERRLLRICYLALSSLEGKLEKILEFKTYPANALIKTFSEKEYINAQNLLVDEVKPPQSDILEGDPVKKMKVFIGQMALLQHTFELLSTRGFIEWEEKTEHYKISLSIRAFDLGRQYSNKWDTSWLWFKEYKDHWIWLIISFIGGVLGAIFVNVLS